MALNYSFIMTLVIMGLGIKYMHQELEVCFHLNGKLIKKAALWHDGQRCAVQVLELRSNLIGTKDDWYPIYFNFHDKYYSARLEFMGIVAEICYENATNALDTSRENIFVRGSLERTRNK